MDDSFDPVPASRSRLVAAGVLALVAFVGLLAGATLDRAYMQHARPHGPHGPGWRGDRAAQQRMRDDFARELSLTPAQRVRVDSIMRHEFAALDSLRAQERPRMHALFEAAHAAIDSVLTPEQRTRFEAMGTRRHDREGPPGRAGPPGGPAGPGPDGGFHP